METCSRESHEIEKANPARWAAMVLVGYQDCGDCMLELRNCRCGSTLCVEREKRAA